MRIIKFRAWDKEDKRMIVHEQEFIPLKVTSIGVLRLSPTFTDSFYSLVDPDRFDLMQFTGLLDKNGKEIYEGDIINAYDHPTNMESVKGVSVVFVACSFRDSYNGYVLQDSYINIEVIGNIHENPELLN